ncbi:MAG: AAC(3) family N-acetyltransferase [Armatimonadota bacterium]
MADKATVTKADIVNGLRAVGIESGAIIGVHSSLSRFGHVEGGAETVVDALLEAVGPTGSVVVPSYSNNVEHVEKTPEEAALGMTWKSRKLPFDPKVHGCWTGKIPDTFWRRPEALRGTHQTHSLSAIGPRAAELIQDWEVLRDLDGHIVLLGVTLHCCSSMHLAEEGIELPQYITAKMTMPKKLRDKYPEDQWEIGYGPYPDFELMEGPCQGKGIMTLVRVGDAVVRRVRLRELIELYAKWLRRSPEVFYHGCVELK